MILVCQPINEKKKRPLFGADDGGCGDDNTMKLRFLSSVPVTSAFYVSHVQTPIKVGP